jgi:histidinol dehydrogenase
MTPGGGDPAHHQRRAGARGAERRSPAQLEGHPGLPITRQALNDWGLIVVCPDLPGAARLSDRFAPEHLELQVERPEPWRSSIQHAGAIFLGAWTPEAGGRLPGRAATTPCPPQAPPASPEP